MSHRWLLSPISLSWTGQTFLMLVIPIAALVIANRGDAQARLTVKTTSSLENIFTPRLGEYFPGTLPWQPKLTTVKQGRTNLNLKLAAYITTWTMSVIDSNETAEIEIRACQPFFAELDPPRVLTQGDRLSLPVVLHNYLDQQLHISPEGRSLPFYATHQSWRLP